MSKESLRPYTVCFTGHREIQHADLPAKLDALLDKLCKQGYRFFGAGGALGFDTEAALAVLRAQGKHPHIKLILILPFPEQAKTWSAEEQAIYEDIKRNAAKVVFTGERYMRGCYHVRNRALVDGAGLCVAYLCRGTGGTAYTVGYAKEQGVKVLNTAE